MGKLRKIIEERIAELEEEKKTEWNDYEWIISNGRVLKELTSILEKVDKEKTNNE